MSSIRFLRPITFFNHQQQLLQHTKHYPLTASIIGSQAPRRNFSFQSFFTTVANSAPVHCVQDSLCVVHDFTGLPWWATIILSTVALRTVITLPLAIYSNRVSAKLENCTAEMPAIIEELKKEAAFARKKFQWSDAQTRTIYNRSAKKQWTKLIVRDNCHPLKTLIVLWGQIPLWIIQSAAIRNLLAMMPDPAVLQAQIAYAELMVGGFGWIPNLCEPDASLIIPITLGLLNLAIIEVYYLKIPIYLKI